MINTREPSGKPETGQRPRQVVAAAAAGLVTSAYLGLATVAIVGGLLSLSITY